MAYFTKRDIRKSEGLAKYNASFPHREKKAIEKNKSAKHNAKSKALLKAKGYTGHYQETATGQIRHQSPSQVAKKKLGA